jgi:hypothetical protein
MAPTGIANGIGIGPFGGRAPFTPTDIAGAVLWLRADLGITEAGSGVSVWADQSGNGNDFAQGTDANRPVLNAAGWSNGLPTVDFTRATPHWMTHSGNIISGHDVTGFGVVALESTGITQDLLGFQPGVLGILAVDRTGALAVYDGTAWRTGSTATTDEVAIAWELDSSAPLITLYKNGSAVATPVYDATFNIPATTVALGAMRPAIAAQELDGKLAEVLVYDRVLADNERDQVFAYLAARYGL